MSRFDVQVFNSLEDLSRYIVPWRELVEAVGQPAALPEWLLAWWHHLAPPSASLTVVIIFEDRRVVAVAPYFAHRRAFGRVEYRPLGAGFSQPVAPVSAPGMEAYVAPLMAGAFARARPRLHVLTFEGLEAASAWPSLLRSGWPGTVRPVLYTGLRESSPTLVLEPCGFDAWLAHTSASFRQEMRKKRRRLERAGGSWQLERTSEGASRGIDAFVRLHEERFAERGGSHFPATGLRSTLQHAARSLLVDERLRVFTVTARDEIVGVQLAVAAGGNVAAWGVSFAQTHAALSPGMLAVMAMIEDAHGRGEHRVDLGWGAADAYKLRIARGPHVEGVVFGGLMPWTPWFSRALATVVPAKLQAPARRMLRRLPPDRQVEIKKIARRVTDRSR